MATVCVSKQPAMALGVHELDMFEGEVKSSGFTLGAQEKPVTRQDVPEVEGLYILHNVFSSAECEQIKGVLNQKGFDEEVGALGRPYRFNKGLPYVWGDADRQEIARRVRPAVPEMAGGALVGMGSDGIASKYEGETEDEFQPHKDNAYMPNVLRAGRLVEDKTVVGRNTFIVYLSDPTKDYEGGDIKFFTADGSALNLRVPKGAVACFPTTATDISPLHEGCMVTKGEKYILWQMLMFPKTEAELANDREVANRLAAMKLRAGA